MAQDQIPEVDDFSVPPPQGKEVKIHSGAIPGNYRYLLINCHCKILGQIRILLFI